MDLKSESVMYLGDNCTTHASCAYIVYIANEVEPTGRCEIHHMAPFYLSSHNSKPSCEYYLNVLRMVC